MGNTFHTSLIIVLTLTYPKKKVEDEHGVLQTSAYTRHFQQAETKTSSAKEAFLSV